MQEENSTPPTGTESNSEGENMECTLHNLVGNDNFFEEVEARLENPNERDEFGYTLLHVAARSSEENCEILQLLLEKNADVDATAEYQNTPLHLAVASRKRYAVADFIEAGANVNFRDASGRTALHFAIGTKWSCLPIPIPNPPCDMWVLEWLLSRPDIDINPVTNSGNTPLMWAVRARNSDAVAALLRKGADPNIPNVCNETPLHAALSSVHANGSIVCALLSKGVGIYCEDETGVTPMDLFIRNLPANDVAQHTVWTIVLRYRVRESLVLGLERNLYLYQYYKRCCEEVRLMKKQIVYDKFTLHDFACDWFHLPFVDPLQDIYMPVVKILLSGSYTEYLDLILKRMTTRNMCRILQKTSGDLAIDQQYENKEHLIIFSTIKDLDFNNSVRM